MAFDKVTRGEKLSSVKLTTVQYGILALMLALTAGLVAAADPGRGKLQGTGGAEPHPQGAGAGSARQAV